MEEIEKFVLSMEEKVTELDAQMQEQVQSLNAKMDAIKALIKEKKIDIDNAKNSIEGRIWRVGDVLLSDGVVVNADNVEDMEEADIQKAEGIVCAVKKDGKIAYILNAKQPTAKFNEKGNYENKLSKYKDGWKTPDIKTLQKIVDNIKLINDILMTLGSPQIKEYKKHEYNGDRDCYIYVSGNIEKIEERSSSFGGIFMAINQVAGGEILDNRNITALGICLSDEEIQARPFDYALDFATIPVKQV